MYQPVQTNQMPLTQKFKNLIWGIVNSTIFRITPPQLVIFRKSRVCMLRLFGAHIPWNASVHPSAKIDYPWNLTMGSLSSIGEKAWVYAMASITIGDKTCIGKNVYILTGSHNIYSSKFELITKPVLIGNCCWLTTGVTVLQGCTIADYSVVTANSTVVKNVEPWTVVGGNPAKFIKKRIIKDA